MSGLGGGDGYSTYSTLEKDETDPGRRNALRGLAAAEKHHAYLWGSRMRELGGPETHYAGQPSGRADSQSNRVGGGGLALRRLEIDESRDIAKYGKQMKMLGDQPSVAFCRK